MYDYLVVGAGLFGSIFAHEAKKRGKSVLVIDKRNHIGGNMYTARIEGIDVHKYGAHIFHTSNQMVWDYMNQLEPFTPFINSPIANYKGKLYSLPFNMHTFYQLWGITDPQEAKNMINSQKERFSIKEPKNLEEQAISLVGPEIYEKLIKGYTMKQWGKDCKDLPAFIIKRLPVRFTFDNNYFNDTYQGIPKNGYTALFHRLLDGVEVRLNQDYFRNKHDFDKMATKVLYTGPIDQFYQYSEGVLEYRSLGFEETILNTDNFQGNPVINYTDSNTPYTRIIEHKHFLKQASPKTIISKEFPLKWEPGIEPYYPINDQKNSVIYNRYLEKTRQESKYLFGGRLATYQYLDMHVIVEHALKLVASELN